METAEPCFFVSALFNDSTDTFIAKLSNSMSQIVLGMTPEVFRQLQRDIPAGEGNKDRYQAQYFKSLNERRNLLF
jgi:hypothetical protein